MKNESILSSHWMQCIKKCIRKQLNYSLRDYSSLHRRHFKWNIFFLNKFVFFGKKTYSWIVLYTTDKRVRGKEEKEKQLERVQHGIGR